MQKSKQSHASFYIIRTCSLCIGILIIIMVTPGGGRASHDNMLASGAVSPRAEQQTHPFAPPSSYSSDAKTTCNVSLEFTLQELRTPKYLCTCSCTLEPELGTADQALFHHRICPDGSMERHRFLCSYWDDLYMVRKAVAFPRRILHIAPEKS